MMFVPPHGCRLTPQQRGWQRRMQKAFSETHELLNRQADEQYQAGAWLAKREAEQNAREESLDVREAAVRTREIRAEILARGAAEPEALPEPHWSEMPQRMLAKAIDTRRASLDVREAALLALSEELAGRETALDEIEDQLDARRRRGEWALLAAVIFWTAAGACHLIAVLTQ